MRSFGSGFQQQQGPIIGGGGGARRQVAASWTETLERADALCF
jgi:hypothetical protein